MNLKDADTNTILAIVKDQIIEQWKKNFTKLKSIELAAQQFSLIEDAALVGHKLIADGAFIYNAPKFYDKVALLNPSDPDLTNVIQFSYDEHYYYYSASRNKDRIIKSLHVGISTPPVTLNPLYQLFWFVINYTQPKNFGSLTLPTTWDKFKERVTNAKKQGDNYIFDCSSTDEKGVIKTIFHVECVAENDVYFPKSITINMPKMKMYSKCEVIKTSPHTINSFGMSFPLQLSYTVYQTEIPLNQSVFETQINTIKVNESVDDELFTLESKDESKISVVDTL